MNYIFLLKRRKTIPNKGQGFAHKNIQNKTSALEFFGVKPVVVELFYLPSGLTKKM